MGSLQANRRAASHIGVILGLVAMISGLMFVYFGVGAGGAASFSMNTAIVLGGVADFGFGIAAILRL